MDGQRLVAVSGSYGADGAEYRTEIDTFSKIISHGSAGNGPGWFEVHTKSGQVMEFGHTADSQILAQGKASGRNWALNKVSDPKTNYFTVSYTNDAANGQFYPIEIDYTGNTAAGVPPNKVQFVYATTVAGHRRHHGTAQERDVPHRCEASEPGRARSWCGWRSVMG